MQNELNQRPAPQPAAAPAKPAQPVRRVGSITLGITLIALGAFFLLYYFMPGLDWLFLVKLSPVLLVALGVEVLVCSFRQERTKYDFLAIFSCLLVICACFGASLLPIVWEYAGPGASAARQALTDQYEDELYGALRTGKEGALALDQIDAWLDLPFGSSRPETLADLGADATLGLKVELSGPYDSAEDFAADCRRVMDAVQAQQPQPRYLRIIYCDKDGWDYALQLDSKVQLDWTAARIVREVEDGRAEWEALAAEQEAFFAEPDILSVEQEDG